METSQIITKLLEFCNLYSLKETPNTIIISLKDVSNYDIELANLILDSPDEATATIKQVLETQLDVIFEDIPNSELIDIWKITSLHVSKFLTIKGYVRVATSIEHIIKEVYYYCNNCHTRTITKKITIKCPGCLKVGGLRAESINYLDFQKQIIEEDRNDLDNNQEPVRILCELKDILCDEQNRRDIYPGVKVKISGILRVQEKKGKKEFKKYIEVHSIEVVEEDISKIKLAESEIKEIEALAKDKPLERISSNIFYDTFGYDEIKKALLLQLIGATPHFYDKTVLRRRGNLNIFLCGSPGTNKTKMAKRMLEYMPNSRFASATMSTGIGLVASISRDDELGCDILVSGVIPMANKSLVVIDECEKLNKEELAKLNSAIEDLEVNIDKSKIHARLKTDVSILAISNPKNRSFDDYNPIWQQIENVPKDFLDRFDLIFALQPPEKKEHFEMIGKAMLQIDNQFSQDVDRNIIKKYIAYARNEFDPIMTESSAESIIKMCHDLIMPAVNPFDRKEEKKYFSARIINNVARLARASSKLHLRREVTPDDIKIAYSIIRYSFMSQGLINPDGTFDQFKSNSIVSMSDRKLKMYMLEYIEKIGSCGYDSLVEFSKARNISETVLDRCINSLSKDGDIIENPRGVYRKI